ncbi:MAG: hypothetical protein ACHQ0J_10930 [Candidatus Dormibacterales bacterium]
MTIPPEISPDGAYWWDGAAWQPMPEDEPAEILIDQTPGPSPDQEQDIPGAEPEVEARPKPPPPSAPPAPAPVAAGPAADAPAPATPATRITAAPPWAPSLPTQTGVPIAAPKPQPKPNLSWLPDDADIPGIALPAKPSPKIDDTAPPMDTIPPPSWNSRAPRLPSRRTLLIAILVVLLVGAAGEGVLAVRQFGVPPVPIVAKASPTPSPSPSPTPSPTALAGPLTAQITASSCSVAHVADHACWKVTFTNTGPAINRLALLFQLGNPYANWFEHHGGASLAGTDASAGCVLDTVRVQIVCGTMPEGGHVTIDLSGFVANVGTNEYGVRFGDIAAGNLADVNLHADGTPTIYSWTEAVT